MEYKVGDRVKIKSKEWYDANKDEQGKVPFEWYNFISNMSRFCGKIATIKENFYDTYTLDINENYHWEEGMFEDEEIEDEDIEVIKDTNKTETLEQYVILPVDLVLKNNLASFGNYYNARNRCDEIEEQTHQKLMIVQIQ